MIQSRPASLYRRFFWQRNGVPWPPSGQAAPHGKLWEQMMCSTTADFLDQLVAHGGEELTKMILADTIYQRGGEPITYTQAPIFATVSHKDYVELASSLTPEKPKRRLFEGWFS